MKRFWNKQLGNLTPAVLVITLVFGLVTSTIFDRVTTSTDTYPKEQVNLGPLALDENFEVYYTEMQRSSSSCFSVVRRTEPASSATSCVTGVINPKDMEVESREMIGGYHERIVILLNALSGFRCTIVIPKNPGPEDIPSIGC